MQNTQIKNLVFLQENLNPLSSPDSDKTSMPLVSTLRYWY